jgi:hypothetical protein
VVDEKKDCEPLKREEIEKLYGCAWTTEELMNEFEVQEFYSPYVFVIRKSDRKRGCLTFQRSPRFYYSFKPE